MPAEHGGQVADQRLGEGWRGWVGSPSCKQACKHGKHRTCKQARKQASSGTHDFLAASASSSPCVRLAFMNFSLRHSKGGVSTSRGG